MKRYTKMATGGLAAIFGAVIAGAIIMNNVIGASTTPDDAAALLNDKLPKLASWVVTLPWWVAAGILAGLVLYVFWAFWPDRTASRKTSEALEKAWEFRNDFQSFRESCNQKDGDIQTALDATLARLESIEHKLTEHSRAIVDVRSELSSLETRLSGDIIERINEISRQEADLRETDRRRISDLIMTEMRVVQDQAVNEIQLRWDRNNPSRG